jgi:hypothetical protein
LIGALFLFAAPALAQNNAARPPDCSIPFYFTGTGRAPSVGYDNRASACTTWSLVYYVEGFSVVSIEVDSAPSVAGAAGTWASWAGSISSGSLPLTSTTSGQITVYKYFPWVSVNLTTATGTGAVSGQLVGWRPFANSDANASPQSGAAAGGTSSNFGAAFPAAGTAIGAKNGLNMVNLAADGSNNLDVNCVVGCAGGSTTPSDAFANPTTAGLQFALNAAWNGASWDRLQDDASKNLKVVVNAALPAGAATIGAVNQGTTPWVDAGNKTNNNAAPGATNFGDLPCIANAATQTWTEGDQVAESCDLSGRQRVRGVGGDNDVAATTDRVPVLPAIAESNMPAAATAGRNTAARTDLQGDTLGAAMPATSFATFTANKLGLASAAAATDISCLPGNATNTVVVTRVQVTGTQTTAGIVDLQLVQRTTADTLGTSAAMTIVKFDTNDGAAVSAPLTYTANPTINSTIGNYDSVKLGVLAPASVSPSDIYVWKPSAFGQSIVLRGTAQEACLNLNGVTVTGGSFDITWYWMETTGL